MASIGPGRSLRIAGIAGVCGIVAVFGSVDVGSAGTIVFANRTGRTVELEFPQAAGASQRHTIAAGDLLPIRTSVSRKLRFAESVQPDYLVEPNAAYFFSPKSAARIELVRIGLGDESATQAFESVWPIDEPLLAQPKLAELTVKLVVDDDERATAEAWQLRLKRRVAAASAILERQAFVRLKVVAVETWQSNAAIEEFTESFAEFEREVRPEPARLAIGFTSQYRIMQGRTHLGGTRGPAHSHLLLREWSHQVTEPERLELLVHELGHFLGAVHSPEITSVMRPVLGDRKARAADFRIGFDPVNALAMCMVGETGVTERSQWLTAAPLGSQVELAKLYGSLAKISPEDPAARQYHAILESESIEPLCRATRAGIEAIVRSAEGRDRAMDGDALTERYVKAAATGSPRAMVLALGLAFDRTGLLKRHRLLAGISSRCEDSAAESHRLEVLGVPTLLGRHELCRHYFTAAALASLLGPREAERSCLAWQMGSQGSGGFSEQLYLAELAGIAFAQRAEQGGGSLDVRLPANAAEVRSMELGEFRERFGSVGDARFVELRERLLNQIGEGSRNH